MDKERPIWDFMSSFLKHCVQGYGRTVVSFDAYLNIFLWVWPRIMGRMCNHTWTYVNLRRPNNLDDALSCFDRDAHCFGLLSGVLFIRQFVPWGFQTADGLFYFFSRHHQMSVGFAECG